MLLLLERYGSNDHTSIFFSYEATLRGGGVKVEEKEESPLFAASTTTRDTMFAPKPLPFVYLGLGASYRKFLLVPGLPPFLSVAGA